MTDISEIPNASQLQQQLNTIYNAIDALGMEGTNVSTLTVVPAASSDPMVPFIMPYSLTLNPPITNPQTLLTMQNALVSRATDLENQLVALGYSNDTNRPPPTPPPGAIARSSSQSQSQRAVLDNTERTQDDQRSA